MLEEGVISFFKEVYLKDSHLKLEDQLKVVNNFPKFFNEDDGSIIIVHVTLGEIKLVLNQFAKDKAPGTHSWYVDFLSIYLI